MFFIENVYNLRFGCFSSSEVTTRIFRTIPEQFLVADSSPDFLLPASHIRLTSLKRGDLTFIAEMSLAEIFYKVVWI